MKREIWLRTNRRAYGLMAVPATTASTAGFLLCLLTAGGWLFWISAGLLIASLLWLARIVLQAWRPRLAYEPGWLLVYLRGVRPIAVPIDVVECFFLGQSASFLPPALAGVRGEGTETATVVIRLAEAARDWGHREVRPSLGQWCEGYITVRGTWCEPLTGELVAGLNQRLVAAHRAARHASESTVRA